MRNIYKRSLLFLGVYLIQIVYTDINIVSVGKNNESVKTREQLKSLSTASEESGKYFASQNNISSNLLHRFPELTTIISQVIPSESKISKPPKEVDPKFDTTLEDSNTIKPISNSKDDKVIGNIQQRYGPPSIVLGYKPITSFYHPRPITIPQIIPEGTPWPDSIDGYQTTFRSTLNFTQHEVFQKTTTAYQSNEESKTEILEEVVSPSIVLNYKPSTSFYHPRPITIPQIVPSGTPWPDSAEGYNKTSSTTEATTVSSKHTTTLKEVELTTQDFVSPTTVLEYKPITSFFHPKPITPAQIIPTGTPWPDSAEGYNTTATFANVTTVSNKVVDISTTANSQSEDSTNSFVPPITVLEYRPITSFHHPKPVTLSQIVPSGTPWPDSIEGYNKTVIPTKTTLVSNTVTLNTDNASVAAEPTPQSYVPPSIVLDYKPITSFYYPKPVTLSQLVSSGTPWPDSTEKYNKTLSTTSKSTTASNKVETSTDEIVPPVTVLEYNPVTSFYHPRPVTIPQIVPSGKPWPDSEAGYNTTIIASETSSSDKIEEVLSENNATVNIFKNKTLNLFSRKIISALVKSAKEKVNLLEPNALQIIDLNITDSSLYTSAPFTSGTPKSTLSDIVDILKDIYNITLVTTESVTSTHSSVFQVSTVTTKYDLNYQDVIVPEQNDSVVKKKEFQVYDGLSISKDTIAPERIVKNPKFNIRKK